MNAIRSLRMYMRILGVVSISLAVFAVFLLLRYGDVGPMIYTKSPVHFVIVLFLWVLVSLINKIILITGKNDTFVAFFAILLFVILLCIPPQGGPESEPEGYQLVLQVAVVIMWFFTWLVVDIATMGAEISKRLERNSLTKDY